MSFQPAQIVTNPSARIMNLFKGISKNTKSH